MANKTKSLKSIVEHFETLADPRHTRNRRHLLGDVIAIAVCGVIVGCSGPSEINSWAKHRKEWLQSVLDLPNGIPSKDCIRRILSTLQPEAFQACFQAWIAACLQNKDGNNGGNDNNNRNGNEGVEKTIAIDGKTMRRSHDRNNKLGPLHLVSAWASEHSMTLGQVATEEKSNEITAIPELLDRIDVKNSIVTIDAMGCQKSIAKKIVDSKGDYVLAVKENQPKLHNAIKDVFDEQWAYRLQHMPYRQHQTSDNGHGRQDNRHYVLVKIPKNAALKKEWPSVNAVGMAVRTTTNRNGVTTIAVRYFIASRFLSGKRFAQAVRGHWGIENSLHWVLDVSFNEDQTRTRNRRAANNLSWLRRFAISLLKQHPSQDSIVGKSRIAGWNNDYLMEVLIAQAV